MPEPASTNQLVAPREQAATGRPWIGGLSGLLYAVGLAGAGHLAGWPLPVWGLLVLAAACIDGAGGRARLTLVALLAMVDTVALYDGAAPQVVLVFSVLSAATFYLAELRTRALSERMARLADLSLQHGTAEAMSQLGSWSIDLAGERVQWSAGLYRILGAEPGTIEVSAEAFMEFVHPEDRATLAAMFDAALTRRTGVSCDFRIVRDDGVLRSLSCTGRVVLGAGGKPLRFVGVTQDVTDRRELQDRLTVSDRLASIGTLAGGIAHEINNPLAYVITNLEVLTDELKRAASAQPAPAMAPLLEMLSEARNGAERVRRIVRDLKVFARVRDDGEGTADLHDVVQLSINMAAHEVRQRARLVRDLQPVPRVRGNEGRLGQVVLNLIVNAAHAIPEGDTGANEIRVSTCTDAAGRVVVEVRDTGCGMSSDLLSHIFDPFFSTKPIGHGMGLGLSISHGIVHAAGGSIEVESETGKGSVFRVILLPSGEPVAAPSPVATASPRSISPAKPRRARVLIVDDEPMIRTSLRRFLGADHDVDATSEGAQVLKALAAGIHYDLILCDLLMPAMTGMDIYDAVRRDHPDQVGSFVFMSGGAFTGRAESFLEEIPNTVLDKPIDVVALRAIIEERLAPGPQPVAQAC